MNRLTRFVDRASSVGIVLGMAGGVIFLIGMVFHPIGGPLGMLIFTVWLIRRWRRNRRRDWSHNVLGENAYQILGVGRYADNATIQRAFRELGRKYHPDAVPPEKREEATAAFVRIEQAYEILSNTNSRYEYDGLIDHSDGRIPSFDEAYLHIRNEDQHPMYAEYERLYPSEKRSASAPMPDLEEHAPRTPEVNSEAGGKPTEWVGREVVDVDVPESVREALGMPRATDPRENGGGS